MADKDNCKFFIPKGFYCYETLSITPNPKVGFIMKVHRCDYYQNEEEDLMGTCLLLNEEIMDEVSICEKDSDEEFYKELEEQFNKENE